MEEKRVQTHMCLKIVVRDRARTEWMKMQDLAKSRTLCMPVESRKKDQTIDFGVRTQNKAL